MFIYLTGGDPVGFRRNILRAGLSSRLRECIAAGRMIVGASGGSLQLTPNLSLFRLLSALLNDVCRERTEDQALGLVDYQLLPHLNRFEGPFLDTVRRYSECVPYDIIALADGEAVWHMSSSDYRCNWKGRRGSATESEAG